MKKNKIPVLKCFPTASGQVKAWCPFCEKWHIHGHPVENKSRKVGHRWSHCVEKNSPFKESGYILKLMTKAEIKAISKSIDLFQTKD